MLRVVKCRSTLTACAFFIFR